MTLPKPHPETPKVIPTTPDYEQHRVNLKREAEVEWDLTERGGDTLGYYDIEDIVPALRRAYERGKTEHSS